MDTRRDTQFGKVEDMKYSNIEIVTIQWDVYVRKGANISRFSYYLIWIQKSEEKTIVKEERIA